MSLGQGQGHFGNFLDYDQLMVLMWSLRLRSSHGQGHLKVTVILRSRSFWNQMAMCFNFFPEAGGWLSSECLSLLVGNLHLTDYTNRLKCTLRENTSADTFCKQPTTMKL